MKRIEITVQELANRHECWVVQDRNGEVWLHENDPKIVNEFDSWISYGNIMRSTLYDVQWPDGLDWTECCVGPEIEPLHDVGGQSPCISESNLGFVVQTVTNGLVQHSCGYFETRAEAIRAWNAVVREISNET